MLRQRLLVVALALIAAGLLLQTGATMAASLTGQAGTRIARPGGFFDRPPRRVPGGHFRPAPTPSPRPTASA